MKSASMMMAGLALAVSASVGFAITNSNNTLCEGFVPENNMKIPVGWSAGPGTSGLTEAQYNEVLDRIERLYSADITQRGAKLVLRRLWNDPTVNARAMQNGKDWVVEMYGGLARHKTITVEGLALAACHELGHHIGGAPKVTSWWGDDAWATNEGGSDYFATGKCLRNFFADDDNAKIIAESKIDPFAEQRCKAQFSRDADQLICMRTSMGGTSAALLFMDLRKEKTPPQFNTPDLREVSRMDDNHPATQCRMDTYFAGTICTVDANVPVSDTDYRAGSCVQGVDEFGWRPRCWFKPTP